MSQLKPRDIPIGINNAVLAFALDLAGVPPGDPPCSNTYDPNILFAIGGGERDRNGTVTRPSKFGVAKLSPLDAAKAAFAEGKPGQITYYFKPTKDFGRLCKAFTDQEKKVAEGERVNTTKMVQEITTAMVSGEMDQAEGVVRLTVVLTKTYITFKHQWKGQAALLKLPNPGRATERPTAHGKIVKSPGWRTVSLNASEQTRKKLNIL